MFRTLYAKLAIVLTLLFLLLGVALLFLLGRASERYQDEVEQRLGRELAAHIVAERLPFTDGELDREALDHIFHLLMVVNPRAEIYLLDDRGSVLAYSAPPRKVRLKSIRLVRCGVLSTVTTIFPCMGTIRVTLSAARCSPPRR